MGWTLLAVLLLVWVVGLLAGGFGLGRGIHWILAAGLVVLLVQLWASGRSEGGDVQ